MNDRIEYLADKIEGGDMPSVTVSDGTKINYYLDDYTDPWEESETILVAHGCTSSGRMLYKVAWGLARRYKVIRTDERGHGESSLPPGGYKASTERLVEDVLNVIDQLGLEKIHFFGQSSGGIVGMYFALSHPDRLKSLILCQTPYLHGAPLADEVLERYRFGEKDVGTAIIKYGYRGWNRRLGGSRLFDLSKASSEMIEWYNNEREKTPTAVAAGRFNWYFAIDLSKRLVEIEVPTLIINAAGGSYMVPLEQGRFMEQQIPNAKLVLIDAGKTQAPHMLAPEHIGEAVLEFLKTIG